MATEPSALVGLEIFSPRRSYTVEGGAPNTAQTFYLAPGAVSSENKAFFIPHFGYNRDLDNGHSLGLSIFANGGMNTEYSGDNGGTFGGGKTGVNLEQVFIAPTWSWEFSEGQALGISPDRKSTRLNSSHVRTSYAVF